VLFFIGAVSLVLPYSKLPSILSGRPTVYQDEVGVVAKSVKASTGMCGIPFLDDGADGRLGNGTGRPLQACKGTFAWARAFGMLRG
jgi:hypothetical protein